MDLEIKHNHLYRVKHSFGDTRITEGSLVKVVEICEAYEPYVYCYGLSGGSAYIRRDNLLNNDK